MNEFHLILSNPHFECRLKMGGSIGLERVSKRIFKYDTALSPIHHLLILELRLGLSLLNLSLRPPAIIRLVWLSKTRLLR
jgi:hypothetical protein